MKKVIAIVLALIFVLALGACTGVTDTTPVATNPAEDAKVSCQEFPNTLAGLMDYMEAKGYLVYDYDASKDEAGVGTIKMDAELIGADEGYKCTYKYDGKLYSVEVYSYSDFNSEFYKQAKAEGKITVTKEIENGTFDVTLSDNGKYALVVHAPNEEEATKERVEVIKKDFKAFYAE